MTARIGAGTGSVPVPSAGVATVGASSAAVAGANTDEPSSGVVPTGAGQDEIPVTRSEAMGPVNTASSGRPAWGGSASARLLHMARDQLLNVLKGVCLSRMWSTLVRSFCEVTPRAVRQAVRGRPLLLACQATVRPYYRFSRRSSSERLRSPAGPSRPKAWSRRDLASTPAGPEVPRRARAERGACPVRTSSARSYLRDWRATRALGVDAGSRALHEWRRAGAGIGCAAARVQFRDKRPAAPGSL